jgi:hypothetical protein
MKLQTPIRISSLKLDETSAVYQQIAQAAMQKVALVTDPSLSKEQRQVMYELHIPELAAHQQHDGRREILPGGQVLDIVEDGLNQKQTYTNRKTNGIAGTVGKREAVNGFLLDMV